jgi:hypothetical protein
MVVQEDMVLLPVLSSAASVRVGPVQRVHDIVISDEQYTLCLIHSTK